MKSIVIETCPLTKDKCRHCSIQQTSRPFTKIEKDETEKQFKPVGTGSEKVNLGKYCNDAGNYVKDMKVCPLTEAATVESSGKDKKPVPESKKQKPKSKPTVKKVEPKKKSSPKKVVKKKAPKKVKKKVKKVAIKKPVKKTPKKKTPVKPKKKTPAKKKKPLKKVVKTKVPKQRSAKKKK